MKTSVAAPAPIAIASVRPVKISFTPSRARGPGPARVLDPPPRRDVELGERDQRGTSRRRPAERASSRHPRRGRRRSAGRPGSRPSAPTRPARSRAPSERGPASSGTSANSAAWPTAAPAPSRTVSASTAAIEPVLKASTVDDRRFARGPRRSRPPASRAGRRAGRRVRRAARPATRARSGAPRRRCRATPRSLRSASVRTATQSPIDETAIAAATMRRSRVRASTE